MKIAVEGCAHGELEIIYESIKFIEDTENIKIDLLLCCGDFQSTRNQQDLKCMAIPSKYYNLGSFYQYYSGEKIAPILTIFIGGNHEASSYLQELPYGGWVAPNIYYLGYSGVLNVNGIRIGGISGIYKGHDYFKGRYEVIPYDNGSIRSVYHIRQLDIFRLKQLSPTIDVFLSHEWPTGVCEYGNVNSLNKVKPFLRRDIESGKLGSKPCEELLKHLKPTYWFSAHLHCKFAALISHKDGKVTKFLALDKCLPQRKFLQVLDVPVPDHCYQEEIKLSYDLEWLTVLFLSNHLLHTKNSTTFMPGPTSNERWQFTPTEEEKQMVLAKLNDNLLIPKNFTKTAPFQNEITEQMATKIPKLYRNSQTTYLCKRLGISDPLELVLSELDQQNSVVNGNDFTENWTDSDMESFTTQLDSFQNPASFTPMGMGMGNIILPDPINSSNDFELDETDEQSPCFESLNKSAEPNNFSKDNTSHENDENNLENINKFDDFQVPIDSPMAKKFKRRNANIYSNNDND